MTTFIGDVIRASARMEFEGVDDVVNVYEFMLTSGPSLDDSQTATSILNVLETIYTPLIGTQNNQYAYRDVRLENVTQSTLLGVFAWPTLTTGASITGNLPPGVSGLINLGTDVAKVILRKYLGGFIQSNLDTDGTFTSALVAVLVAVANILLSPITEGGNTWDYGYISSKTLLFERPVSATITDIPAYQRRRKQGRGS